MADGQLSYQIVFDGIQDAIAGLKQLGSTVASVASTIQSNVGSINSAFASIKSPNLGGLSGFTQQAQAAAGAATQVGAAAGGAGGGLNNLGNAAGGAAPKVNSLGQAWEQFGGILKGAAVLEIGKQLIEMSDNSTQAFNRIKAATKTPQEAEGVFQGIVASAQATRQPLEQTAEQFQQVTIATNALGLSYKQQIGLNQELNQLLVVSGASGQKAKAGIGDLLRGLAAGKITTQELKGMVHDVPQLGQAIATGMGVGIGSLRELNKEGKLTSQAVVAALQKVAPSITADFAKMTPTIGQGFTVIKTGIESAIHSFNDFTGAGSGIANLLVMIGDHAGVLIGALAGIGVVLVGTVVPEVVAFGVALLATPVGWIGAALATIGAALGYFGGQSVTVSGQTATGWQLIKAVIQTGWDYIRPALQAFGALLAWLPGLVRGVGDSHETMFNRVTGFLKVFANALIGGFVAAWEEIKAVWNNFPGFMDALFVSVVNLAASAAEKLLNIWQAPLRAISALASKVAPDLAASVNGVLDSISVKLPRAQASAAGKAFGDTITAGVKKAFNTDFVGNFGNAVVGHLKQITKAAHEASDATGDIQGGTSPEGGADGKKKKKGKAPQESDYAMEVKKLTNDTYDEGLTKEQLQLADALDSADLGRNIEQTGKLADNIKRLVKNLQDAHATRQFNDALKDLQDAYAKLGLTEEQQAQYDARKAAGLPTDLKVVNDRTKAIDAQAAANYNLKKSQDAAKENASRLDRLNTGLGEDKQKHQDALDARANGYSSTLDKQNEKITKHYDTYRHILATMKDMDPVQKQMLQTQIDQEEQDEKADAQYQARLDKTQKLSDFLQNLWENPRDAMKQFFTDFLKNLLIAIAKATILKGLLGGRPGGSFGSMLSGALSSALGFGGGKAKGGGVSSNKFYLVGENGPELFAPGVGGSIIPNHQLGGGGSTSVTMGGTTIVINGGVNDNTLQQFNQQMDQWQRSTAKLIDQRLQKQRR